MPKNVLVVDDDQSMHDLIHLILQPPDYEVVDVEDGELALQRLLAGEVPDILLLDLMMPNMTGYVLLNQIYEQGLHQAFSTIVMSADVLTRQQMVKLGIKGFLTKPFDVSSLEQLVKEL